jgi:hypothetical protein
LRDHFLCAGKPGANDSSAVTPVYEKCREKAWFGMPVALRISRSCSVIHLSSTSAEYEDGFSLQIPSSFWQAPNNNTIAKIARRMKKATEVLFTINNEVVIVICFVILVNDYWVNEKKTSLTCYNLM